MDAAPASGCDGADIGTGFIIGPRLVATVEHVVAGATSITLLQGGRVVGTGTVIGEDPARDVALVRTSMPGDDRSMRNCESPLCRSAGVPLVRKSPIM